MNKSNELQLSIIKVCIRYTSLYIYLNINSFIISEISILLINSSIKINLSQIYVTIVIYNIFYIQQ